MTTLTTTAVTTIPDKAPAARTIDRQALDPEVIERAVKLWAKKTTRPDTDRRDDLIRDKTRAVSAFFQFVGKHPAEVIPADVENWIESLTSIAEPPAEATVYAMVSKVSSWYTWAMADKKMGQIVTYNPVISARPEAPKPYHNAQALSDEEVNAILDAIPADTPTGARDRAMFLFYILTGIGGRKFAACDGAISSGMVHWSSSF